MAINNNRTFLGGLGISLRLYLLIGIALVGFVGFLALFFFADKRLETTLERLEAFRQIAALTAEVGAGTLKMQRREWDFTNEGGDNASEGYKAEADKVLNALNALGAMPEASPVRNHVETVHDGVVQYIEQFSKLTAADTPPAADAPEVKRLGEIFSYMTLGMEALSGFAADNATQARQQVISARIQGKRLLIIDGVAIVLLLIVGGVALTNSVTRPLKAIRETTTQLAYGNHSITVPAIGNKDDVGDMARALQGIRNELEEVQGLRAAQEIIGPALLSERREDTLELAEDFQSRMAIIVEAINSTLSEVRETASNVPERPGKLGEITAAVAAARIIASSAELSKQSEILQGEIDWFLTQLKA